MYPHRHGTCEGKRARPNRHADAAARAPPVPSPATNPLPNLRAPQQAADYRRVHGCERRRAASLAALSYGKGSSGGKSAASLAGGARSPFKYVKGEDGHTVIRVTEEFVVNAVSGGKPRSNGGGDGSGDDEAGGCGAALCSTPELRKHYEQLVGAARVRSWSPRLDTIKERKGRRVVHVVSPGRCSPVRLLGIGKGLS
ncbi:hypothetical protein EJB05_10735, partial [Eragrostis curvula]